MSLRLISRGFRYVTRSFSNMSFPESPAKASICCEKIEGAPPTYAMYEALKDSCQNNATYFQPDESENGQRLYQGFITLIDHIDTVWPLVDHVRKVAPVYDFDEKTPGNGYRSFVSVVDSCILHGLKLSRQVCSGRDALLFRKGYFVKEVESCGQLLASLGTCLNHLHTLISWAPPGDLFPVEPHSPEELFSKADTINQYCFYGRCLGFQFAPSIRGILKGISICMAGFSEAYYSQGNLISSVWTGGQYLIDPELRARRIVNISQSASVDFCKAFWFLTESEIMRRVPSLMSSAVAVNRLITIKPEPLVLKTADGEERTFRAPSSHIGLQDLNVRLISVSKRNGMQKESSGLGASAGVVFHCHGGGFVAQSSKSHESYLRDWAAQLDVPIVSVDYSLAPQAPFPRASEEVFFAYCWLLSHLAEVGSTGARIVAAGDSAGANLLAGCVLRALRCGLRAPDGLFLAYAPLLVSFVPSPSRLLCLMDPLLPFGFMMRCLKAYASPKSTSGEDKPPKELPSSLATTPLDSNGFRTSPSQDGVSLSSGSDLLELQARQSPTSPRRHSADTTASAAELDSRGDESGTPSTLVGEPPLAVHPEQQKRVQTRISEAATGLMGAVSSRFAHLTDSNAISGLTQQDLAVRSNLDCLIARSPSDEFVFSVPRDPLLSPYWAEDHMLQRFPPVRILSVHMDPCLDDCVMFAKKLKRLGNDVEIDVVEGLPHGFLNLSLMAKEANDASLQCIARIKQLLETDSKCEKL